MSDGGGLHSDDEGGSRAKAAAAWMSVVGGAIAVISALVAGRPVSTTVLAVLLILAGPAYLVRRHLGGSGTGWRRRDWAILTAAGMLIVASAVTMSIPASRGPVLHGLLGWPDNSVTLDFAEAIAVPAATPPSSTPSPAPPATPPDDSPAPSPTVARASVPSYPDGRIGINAFNGVLAVVTNNSDTQVLVTEIRVVMRLREGFLCYQPLEYRFTIEGDVGVNYGGRRKIEGFAAEGTSDRAFPLSGTISGIRCRTAPVVDARLSVAMNLAPNARTNVEVLLGRTVFDAICEDPTERCPYSVEPGSPQVWLTLSDGSTIRPRATAR